MEGKYKGKEKKGQANGQAISLTRVGVTSEAGEKENEGLSKKPLLICYP